MIPRRDRTRGVCTFQMSRGQSSVVWKMMLVRMIHAASAATNNTTTRVGIDYPRFRGGRRPLSIVVISIGVVWVRPHARHGSAVCFVSVFTSTVPNRTQMPLSNDTRALSLGRDMVRTLQ